MPAIEMQASVVIELGSCHGYWLATYGSNIVGKAQPDRLTTPMPTISPTYGKGLEIYSRSTSRYPVPAYPLRRNKCQNLY